MDDKAPELMQILQMEIQDDDIDIDMIFESSSEEEETKVGGSRKGRAPNKKRDFVGAYHRVVNHHFNGRESVHDERDFERRFRVPRTVFNRIHDALMGQDPFTHKTDPTGKKGIHPLVKLVACFRHIACGDALDREDENLHIGESTLDTFVKQFAKLVKQEFGAQYLNRCPNEEERKSIEAVMRNKGFPGCLASWDCKHFVWKNCPLRLAGQHQGHAEGGKKTLTMEAITDHRRHLWHVNFGDAGSLNDINVLDKSSIIAALLAGELGIKIEPHMLNSVERDWMHFLVDGIYPEWSIFVNTHSDPTEPMKKKFAAAQERVRKDIACAFGVPMAQFHVLLRPFRRWFLEDIKDVLDCCVIIHNMIVEERSGKLVDDDECLDIPASGSFPLFGFEEVTGAMAACDGVDLFAARVAAFDSKMQSSHQHCLLKRDLVQRINATMP